MIHAILGTGLIGAGMTHNLVQRSHDVVVWNRTRAKAEALRGPRVIVADTAVDAVRSATRVHLALTDDHAVDAVLAVIADALPPGAIVIDHTTTQPAATAARAARCAERGIPFLHAPVFMSPANARSGSGLMLAAGPQWIFAAVDDDLRPMTGEVWYLGERPDLAAAYKLFGNAMILAMTGALADIFRMADAVGVPREEGLAVFQKFSPVGILQFRGPKMAKRDFTPSFALSVARKDIRLMQETVGDDAPSAILSGLAARMEQLIAQGYGELDVGVLAV